jgi:hypothetical protein
MKLFRFSNFASSIHAVADWPGVRAVSSRWRRWLAVGLLAGSAGASEAQVVNGGFDAVPLSPGQYLYYGAQSQPVDSWTYAGAAGIATDSSNKVNFATGYPGVYAGTNYAFLQTSSGTPSALEQSVMLPSTGQWLMSFDFAGRLAGTGFGGDANFHVSVINSNNIVVAAKGLVTSSGQLFTNQTVAFTAQNNGPFALHFGNVQSSSGGTDDTVFIDNVRLISAPAITSQPADQVVSWGQTATLSVGASGTPPFTYQWYSGGLGDTSNPVGTNSSYTTPPLGADATFWVQVRNDAGPNYAATSRLVSVLHITTALTQQPSGLTVCPGNSATFTVGVGAPHNVPSTVQWQRRVLGGSFTNIPGATTTNYTIPAVSAADDGSFFRALVSNSETNLVTVEAPLSVATISAPTIVYDFSSGMPTNTLYTGDNNGHATTGLTTNGWLDLNDPGSVGEGMFLTADLAPGQAVRGFMAHFTAYIIPDPPYPMGNGFSFNWGPDVPSGVFAPAEQGAGSGLRVCFITYDDGSGYAPAIDVKWGDNVVGHFKTTDAFLSNQGTNADVMVRLNTDGTFDMTYRCVSIFTRLPIPGYQEQFQSRFGLESQSFVGYTVGEETVWIRDVSVQLFVDPSNGLPCFTSMAPQAPSGLAINGTGAPNGQYPLFTSQDLVNWQFRTNVILGSNGLFQFVEPDISSPARQFYRLKAAPNLPAGLVSWWRGDGNYLDSIGPRNGIPSTNAPGFTAGERTPAFNFGGTNALSVNSASLPAPWTLCFWVIWPPSATLPEPIQTVFSDTNSSLDLDADGQGDAGLTLPSGTIAFTNSWWGPPPPGETFRATFFAFVSDSTNLWLYNDDDSGVEMAYQVGSASGNFTLPLSVMGAGIDGVSNGLNVVLDEVMLFGRALTPAEVSQVVNATRAP